jgi:hypothetical protein
MTKTDSTAMDTPMDGIQKKTEKPILMSGLN